jgi:hypothetical protein
MNRPPKKNKTQTFHPPTPEHLHVYGVSCSWHGDINEVKLLPPVGIPCCPHCQGVLFQIEESKWFEGAIEHEKKGHTNYVEFLEWITKQTRCWPEFSEAAFVFERETGKKVILKL